MPREPIPTATITVTRTVDDRSLDAVSAERQEASRVGERTYRWTDGQGNTYQQSVILLPPCMVAHDPTTHTLHVIPLEHTPWRPGMTVLELVQ